MRKNIFHHIWYDFGKILIFYSEKVLSAASLFIEGQLICFKSQATQKAKAKRITQA